MLVNERPDAPCGHGRKSRLQTLEDQLLGGPHRRGLSTVGVVILDVEQRLTERLAVIHGQDEQRIVVPRLPTRVACHGRHGTRPMVMAEPAGGGVHSPYRGGRAACGGPPTAS